MVEFVPGVLNLPYAVSAHFSATAESHGEASMGWGWGGPTVGHKDQRRQPIASVLSGGRLRRTLVQP